MPEWMGLSPQTSPVGLTLRRLDEVHVASFFVACSLYSTIIIIIIIIRARSH